MSRNKYSVITYKGEFNDFPVRSHETDNAINARSIAKKWVDQYPEERIYIEFFRASDGQTGYINPNGYDLTGIDWGGDRK